MTNASMTKWTFGRSRDCDVVVDADGIEARHCELLYQQGTWSVVPLDGQVAIRDCDQDSLRWSRDRVNVSASDSLWLTKNLKLPWPSETDARACLTVGRASDGDIVLPSSHISGRHALLIVGQNGTWVIRDLDSRNGLFIDEDFNQRISAVMLLPGRSVYLGSERIDASELVSKAKAVCPTIKSTTPTQPALRETATEVPPRIKLNPAPRQPTTAALKTVVSAIVPSVLAIGIWWMFLRPSTDDVDVVPTTSREEHSSAATIASVAPTIVQPTSTAIDTVFEQARPSESVYWVLVRHNESGNYFRLGSAVAVSANTLLSTASIVTAMEAMGNDGYSAPSIAQVTTGRIFKVISRHAFPEFVKRTQMASVAVAQYEGIATAIGDDAAKAAQSRDELNKKAELVNVAMAATAAVDVGWLHVDSLPSFLDIDATIQYRPSQSLSGLAAGFDAEDPFFVASTMMPKSIDLRVKTVGAELSGYAGVVALDGARSATSNQNLIGSPLIRDDRLVGMIVFQDAETGTIEAIPASVIAKALSSKTPK